MNLRGFRSADSGVLSVWNSARVRMERGAGGMDVGGAEYTLVARLSVQRACPCTEPRGNHGRVGGSLGSTGQHSTVTVNKHRYGTFAIEPI